MKIIHGDCLEVMKRATENSIDAIVTDPPYGLSFMGKKWDYDVPSSEIWGEAYRVLKPGGYLLAFAGTRTYHRMAVNIEDAKFEIRDMIEWVYGSGFPKSLNIGKAVDKLQGNEREVLGLKQYAGPSGNNRNVGVGNVDEGENKRIDTKGTSEWEGWGTALKPAHEPICMARKPIESKTVAENVLKYGTGGINIDESRVGTEEIKVNNTELDSRFANFNTQDTVGQKYTSKISQGRFPANLIHDNSEEVRECFPETKSSGDPNRFAKTDGGWAVSKFDKAPVCSLPADSGNASRFFKSIIYQAKASKNERNKGCEGLEEQYTTGQNKWTENDYRKGEGEKTTNPTKNNHPTVKPIALMEYLIKMVTPKGGKVLDPFMGSGTTGIACKNLGFDFVGIEMDEGYCKIAKARIDF